MAAPEIQLIESVVNNWPVVAITATALLGLLSFKQRMAIKERDHFQCQHPDKSISHGGGLEVDHILPQRWGYNKLGLTEEQVDSPLNLVVNCRNHHRGHPNSRHPDAHKAWENYHEDKEAFHKLFSDRDGKLAKGEKYWNDTYDEELLRRARQNTEKAASEHSWKFPKKNGHKNGN